MNERGRGGTTQGLSEVESGGGSERRREGGRMRGSNGAMERIFLHKSTHLNYDLTRFLQHPCVICSVISRLSS